LYCSHVQQKRGVEHCCFRLDLGNEGFICDITNICDLHTALVAVVVIQHVNRLLCLSQYATWYGTA